MVNRTLDFNSLTPPTLELTMMDDAHTVLAVTPPTEEEVERVTTLGAELKGIMAQPDGAQLQKVYAFVAELLSHNLDGTTVTAEELTGKYRLRQWHLLELLRAYVDFIKALNDAKN